MKESSVVVGAPQRGRKSADVKKDINLKNLVADYWSMAPEDFLGRISNVCRQEN